MGFRVGVRVVLGVVFGPVLGACIQLILKLILGCPAKEHQNCISIILDLQGTIVLLVSAVAVELSIWIGLLGWG
jgi:hypothetical protein